MLHAITVAPSESMTPFSVSCAPLEPPLLQAGRRLRRVLRRGLDEVGAAGGTAPPPAPMRTRGYGRAGEAGTAETHDAGSPHHLRFTDVAWDEPRTCRASDLAPGRRRL